MLLMRKYDEENSACLLSHPVRGAWIEMKPRQDFDVMERRRTPSGVRGLKFRAANRNIGGRSGSHPVRGAWIEISFLSPSILAPQCRTPSGVRGLKFHIPFRNLPNCLSHPVRGAWIEMQKLNPLPAPNLSHPVRGAWIEIFKAWRVNDDGIVAPRQGCVD